MIARAVGEAIERLPGVIRPGDLVLVKASRVARLERVVEALRATGDSTVRAPGGATERFAAACIRPLLIATG